MPYVRGYVRRQPHRTGLFARRYPRRYSRRSRLPRETEFLVLIALVVIILALATH
jgi:hypothetical protein